MTKLTPAGQAVESELLGLLKATVEPWVYNAIASAAIEAAKQSGQVVERDCAHDRPFCCEERAKAYGKPTPPTGPASPTEEEREHCRQVVALVYDDAQYAGAVESNSYEKFAEMSVGRIAAERAAARAKGYGQGRAESQLAEYKKGHDVGYAAGSQAQLDEPCDHPLLSCEEFGCRAPIEKRLVAELRQLQSSHERLTVCKEYDALQAKLNDLLESAERTTKHAKSNGMEDWPVFKKLRAAIERART
jgi:hypothetical protein